MLPLMGKYKKQSNHITQLIAADQQTAEWWEETQTIIFTDHCANFSLSSVERKWVPTWIITTMKSVESMIKVI